MNYYNDFDKKSCAWLRELIKAKLIPDGAVDDRSIKDVSASDLLGFNQVHFFAGIGGWPLALRLAGVPETERIWTGSCPCQPFSIAGKRKGTADERHLWPEFKRLIADGKPTIVFGEQVAAKDGRVWLSGVRSDLEALGYAVGAADLCAAGIGAPHIRQRLYWVGYASGNDERGYTQCKPNHEGMPIRGSGSDSGMADDTSKYGRLPDEQGAEVLETIGGGAACRVANNNNNNKGLEGHTGNAGNRHEPRRFYAQPDGYSAKDSWGRYKFIPCGDGKTRRIEPGISPLAYGLRGRVGLLRGYGNAIVPQVAVEFIQAFFDIKADY